MRYLVEITYENGQAPLYQYYNTFTDIYQTISKTHDIEFIEIYTLDKEKTDIATKMINEKITNREVSQ